MRILNGILIVGAMVLAGCEGDRFGGTGGNSGTGGASVGFGGPDDPTSPAYFQEVVGDRVLFAVDQSTLSPLARSVLGAQARWMTANPGFTAIIEGHADERGTTEYNIALGARRAAAVQEYLFNQGVALNRMQVVSYGKERPIEICSDEGCYEQNRRAVTVLRAGSGV